MAVRDVVQAAAGVAGGGEYVEDVFSTYLYTGNGSTQTITNGIDLDGEGGLVWVKSRSNGNIHLLYDTERGALKYLTSQATQAESTYNNSLTAFNSDGFSVGSASDVNLNTQDTASWTFRKAPKFFDVVTWTGTGGARTISHNLGSTPGCIIVKWYNVSGENWTVYHRGLNGGTNPQDYGIYLNLTNAAINESGFWNDTEPTSTQFTVGGNLNSSFGGGGQFVAYLFAHDAGGFGDDGQQNVISCGSFTTDGSGNATVDLGYEPQWVMNKTSVGTADNWLITDTMRGASHTSAGFLFANLSNAEGVAGYEYNTPTANGFNVRNHSSSTTYIYIAIRRPMKTPESGTEVFAIDTSGATAPTPPAFNSGFPVDMAFYKQTDGSSGFVSSRLTSNAWMALELTQAETANAGFTFDFQDGWRNNTQIAAYRYSWMFRRASGFMDVVAYTGTGAGTQLVYHNLQVSPELVIIKRRDGTGNWLVNTLTNGSIVYSVGLNSTSADNASLYQGTAYSAPTYIGVRGTSLATISSATYIAYLFATLPGVSKVGSYTGTGADINVDCGFSSGARFVLIKRTDSSGDWYVWDSARGIVSGNDPYLLLNSPAAEVTSTDYIDPLASGFTVTSSAPAALNASGGSYIFLAIA